jgi:hypothetical protein
VASLDVDSSALDIAAGRTEDPDQSGPDDQRASRIPALKRAARDVAALLTRMIGTALAVALVISTGLWSSRAMINRGYAISTDSYGSWRHWRVEGRRDADPYTRAHLSGSGMLRISSDSAGVFDATVDNLGARLHSSCDYVIEGANMGSLWWSLTVFNSSGDLIANDANRYTFTSETTALNPDGSFIITLGRDARPGNWLPTGHAGRLVLNFTILDPSTGLSNDARTERNKLLPAIRREGCS